ncbi:MAG: ATP-binding protein, partial [Gemmatimonadaceae bacterium]|nr:ATP-binding protein [Gemmatimonadaceae bacterium]
PLAGTAAVARAIAAGDASQRVPPGATAEVDQLASSVNTMTEQLLDAHQLRMRVDKLATMGRLAAGIAHEVGNPLGAIATYVHVARERVTDDPKVTHSLDAIEREVGRIDRIVRGLLDYARPRRVTPRAVEINGILEHALHLLADQGIMRRVDLRRDLDDGAPSVFAEHHDVEQVFVNLLLNAVDAMDGTGRLYVRTRRLRIRDLTAAQGRRSVPASDRVPHLPSRRTLAWLERADRPDVVLQVIIADSGPGVPLDDAERIFDPFYTTKPTGKGTGLGLAIVASTVENLGGTIWVQRAREGGAAFVILLPLLGISAPADLPYLDETLSPEGETSGERALLPK